MREILFRGKDIKENWHIGLLARVGNVWYVSNKTGVATAFEVIPSTIGQYTGLTDKNGTLIFEGDILRTAYHPEDDVAIEWHDGSFHFKKVRKPKGCGYECIGCVQNAVDHLKVIGNIFDNPELLRSEEQYG